MSITLDESQYEALITLARQGVAGQEDRARGLEDFIRLIESENDITRYTLLVRWQEIDSPLPAGTSFPRVWPPELQETIERLDRPIARIDVDAVLKTKARKPTNVMVTTDVGGVLGWTLVEDWFR